jgi:hypothetical protein
VARDWADPLASPLLSVQAMTNPDFIGIHHLSALGRRIPVVLSRNRGGSVAGRCLLGAGDTPIVDGPDTESVLSVLQRTIEGLLLARNGPVG